MKNYSKKTAYLTSAKFAEKTPGMVILRKGNEKVLLSLIFLLFLSCTEFIADPDLQEDWLISENQHFVLHYRPGGFSESPSPTPSRVNEIMANQAFYYAMILDSIKQNFNEKVLIYLFNKDEAGDHIGTSGGGHSIPKLNTFYFSYLAEKRNYTDKYGIEDPPLGAHELVHVITHRTLGYPGTKLMSEGYANWLDGGYSSCRIEEIVKSYRDKNPEKILTPGEFLQNPEIQEQVYYPNVGIFIRFLIQRYGVTKINRLFPVRKENFVKVFESTCGEQWSEMGDEYQQFIEKL